jgi:4-oxalocrotonate tautomerase
MPHVIVKLWPGKSEAQRRDLTAAIVRETGRILDYGNEAVSVGFEEIRPEDWTARVYEPDIVAKWSTLTKQPGYGPGAKQQSEGE